MDTWKPLWAKPTISGLPSPSASAKKARVGVLAAPVARLDTPKCSPRELGREEPDDVASGHVDTVAGEADDVGDLVAVYVRKLTRVEVLASPAARLGPPERSPHRQYGGQKAPHSVGQGHINTVTGEAHDFGHLGADNARKLARVGVLAHQPPVWVPQNEVPLANMGTINPPVPLARDT